MFINNVEYCTDMSMIGDIKYTLLTSIYNDNKYIESLKNCISNRISCIDISYDETTYTFELRIRKTTMRRIKGYNNVSDFYYTLTPDIFSDFFKNNLSDIRQALIDSGHSNLVDVLFEPAVLTNMCSVMCYTGYTESTLCITIK